MCSGCLGLIDNQGDGIGVGIGVGVGVDVVESVTIGEGVALGVGAGVNVVLGTEFVMEPEPHSAPIEVNLTPV